MTLGAGEVVGEHYVLDAHLGSEVWRAIDRRTGLAVAVRIVGSPDDEGRDSGFAPRLHINARMLSKLRDRRLVAVIESGEDPVAGLFLVTELASGQPLRSILEREGRLTSRRTMMIIAGAAEALGPAHEFGVWHRDLHPGCLFVDAQDRVELGMSNVLRRSGASSYMTQRPAYLSPEEAWGERPCPESDIYALGIIAYECLTGAPPFTSDNPIQVAYLQATGVPAPLPADVPPCVAAIVDRALAKRAADRWSRPADLAVAARSCAAELDTE
jgi:serine/threonine-protein kinase